MVCGSRAGIVLRCLALLRLSLKLVFNVGPASHWFCAKVTSAARATRCRHCNNSLGSLLSTLSCKYRARLAFPWDCHGFRDCISPCPRPKSMRLRALSASAWGRVGFEALNWCASLNTHLLRKSRVSRQVEGVGGPWRQHLGAYRQSRVSRKQFFLWCSSSAGA